jgi:hypothetical protein
VGELRRNRTNPALTSSTSNPAAAKANGAARPINRAGSGPTIDMARVGAITPIDTAAVPHRPSTRRRLPGAGRFVGCIWTSGQRAV